MKTSIVYWSLLFFPVAALTAQEARGTPEQIERLIAALKADGKAEEKHAACRELALIGTGQAVPALAAMLSDVKLSQPARNALENIPGPAVDEALRAAIHQLKDLPLVGVINSIGARRDARAVDALAGLLTNDDPEVVASAALSLGKIGTTEAGNALKAALIKASPATLPALTVGGLGCADAALGRKSADEACALYDLIRTAAVPAPLRMAGMRGALNSRGLAGIELLVEQLRGSDAAMFTAALRVARELPGVEVTKALADELGKLPPDRQLLVLRALGDRRDGTALSAVLSLGRNGPLKICATAAGVLTQIGDASVLPVLAEWMASPEADVARAAQTAMACFQVKEADAAITALLAQTDPKTRAVAIHLIGQRRMTCAMADLLKAATDADEHVRLASLNVLAELAGSAELPASLDLLSNAKSPREMEAAERVVSAVWARQADREAGVDRVVARFNSAQGDLRRPLLRVLCIAGGAQALAVVRTAAETADLKDEAQRMLCDWPTTDALPDISELARTSNDAKVKILALRGCFRLIPKQDVPVEKRLAALKDALSLVERVDERKLALAALAETPHPEAGRMIAQYLSDDAVKAEADNAILHLCQLLGSTNPSEARGLLTQLIAATTDGNLKRQAQRAFQQFGKAAGDKLNGAKVQATAVVSAEALTAGAPNPQAPTNEGWTELFNGRDLTGWEGAPGWWFVEDGALTSQSTPEKPCKQCNYLIWKGGKPSDFELLADFRLSIKANSGIQIRSETRPDWDTFGHQADMTGDGGLVGFVYHHAGGMIAGRGKKVTIGADGKKTEEKFGDPKELLKSFKKEDWNTYRIVCRGPEITLYVNDVLMCQYTDRNKANAASSGIIALQMHPGPPMKVQFKNIRLKELK